MRKQVIYEDPQGGFPPAPTSGDVKLIRRESPSYYVPENPYTDDDGFMPHDGRGKPEWVQGKLVSVKYSPPPKQHTTNYAIQAESWRGWSWKTCFYSNIVAYRIVSIEPESTDTWITGRPMTGDGVRRQKTSNKTKSPRVELKWGINRRRDGKAHTELHAPCGCAFHPVPAPHWHQCPRHASNNEDVSKEPEIGGDTSVHYPDGTPVEEPVFEIIGESPGITETDPETRHRDHLAALLRQPVPGCSEWLHGSLREARRHEYRVAALQGLSANPSFEDTSTGIIAGWAREQADEMIQKEDSE